MADFTTAQNRSKSGWIVAVIVVVLVLLYVLFGGSSVQEDGQTSSGDGATPATQDTPAETTNPAPAPAD